MDIHKIIGYILLFAGLLFIVASLYQTYAIFIGKSLPPEVFKSLKMTPPSQNSPLEANNNQQQIQKAVDNILPLDLLNNTLNLAVWLILASIFIFGGKQLADIGIKLLKND